MAKYHHPRHTRSARTQPHRHQEQAKTGVASVLQYGLMAVALGMGAAWAWSAYEAAQLRRAALEALPAGYEFPACDAVRARGLDPLYRGEPGFSERMDGDGDGIACEPYR